MKSYQKHLKESVLDYTKDNLSDKVWTKDKKLKPNVRKQIMDIFSEFEKNIKLDLEYKSIIMVGSMTGYNYNDESDIDINVEFYTDNKERIRRLRKIAPNGQMLDGTKHPINFYFMYKDEMPNVKFTGIYDILNDKWIKKETKDKINPADFWQSAVIQAVSWGRKITLDVDELKRDMMELKLYKHFLKIEDDSINKDRIKNYIQQKEYEIKADYDVLAMNKHVMREFRSEAIRQDRKFDSLIFPKDVKESGDYSLNNVVFKILEKFGYWKMCSDIKKQCKEDFPELVGEDEVKENQKKEEKND